MTVDTDAYEQLGDLDAPFEISTKNERRQRDREHLRDSVRCDVAPLTFEQYRAGAPCPGCGRPYLDAEPFEFKGTMNLSDRERELYEAEQSRFKAKHGSCRSHRHSVTGSLTTHCGKCCPMPPMSPSQWERIGAILALPTPMSELMVWRLRLYCGHTVERQAHRSHKTVQSAFSGAVNCTECGRDPSTVIDARTIGLAAPSPQSLAVPTVRKPTRAALERRIEELEAEVTRLRDSSVR